MSHCKKCMPWICLMCLCPIILLLIACSSTTPIPSAKPDMPTAPASDELVDAYISIIDTLYSEDHGLNSGIKYIAVDTSKIINLDRTAQDKLLKGVEKYGCVVLEDDFDGLTAKGYIKDMLFTDGLLFKIEDAPASAGAVTVQAEKWRAGAGSIRYTFDLKELDGTWKIDKKYDFMIS